MPFLRSPRARLGIATFTVLAHLIACGGLLVISSGTETNPDWESRLRFVREHRGLWCSVWVVWMVTSASLLLFCVAWVSALSPKMRAAGMHVRQAKIACGIIAVGLLFDFAGETTLIIAGLQAGDDVAPFAQHVRIYQILSPAIANGLYGVGGLMLSVLSWRIGWMRDVHGLLGFAVWLAAFALTLGAILDHRQLMIAAGGLVMVLFLLFASDMGWRMFQQGSPVDDDTAVLD